MSVPNVLATRYAGADLAAIWSPEHKIVLERQLWLAVLRAHAFATGRVVDDVAEDIVAGRLDPADLREPVDGE